MMWSVINRTVLLTAIFTTQVSTALAESDTGHANQPAQLLAVLANVQDDIALNGAAALDVQAYIFEHLGEQLLDASNSQVISRDTTLDIIEFALAGGSPRTSLIALRKIPVSNPHFRLTQAVKAFLRRESTKAIQLFKSVNSNRYRGRVNALIKLASGSLKAATGELEAAVELLEVGSLAPGTLLEEAASRRLGQLYKKHSETQRLMRVAAQYWQRFPNSPYRKEFERLVIDYVIDNDSDVSREGISRLVRMSQFNRTAAFASQLSRAAIFAGKTELADFAVGLIPARQEAGKLAKAKRSSLLKEIAQLTSEGTSRVAKRLMRFDPNGLTMADRKLLRASRHIVHAIQAPIAEVPAQLPSMASNDKDVFVEGINKKLEAIDIPQTPGLEE